MKQTTYISTTRPVKNTSIKYAIEQRGSAISLSVSTDVPNEHICIEDIAADTDTAVKIMMLLADNLVFPSNVYEILDDIIGV